jgi:hypothetical protein
VTLKQGNVLLLLVARKPIIQFYVINSSHIELLREISNFVSCRHPRASIQYHRSTQDVGHQAAGKDSLPRLSVWPNAPKNSPPADAMMMPHERKARRADCGDLLPALIRLELGGNAEGTLDYAG